MKPKPDTRATNGQSDDGDDANYDGARSRALIVDSDPRFLQQVESLLEQEGFDSVSETSGAAAVAALDAAPFDLVLCGPLDEPGSHAVVEHARGVPRGPAILLVMPFSESARKAEQPPHDSGLAVLFRPLDPSELGHTVAWLMHERHLRLQGFPASDLAALYRIATVVNGGSISPPILDRVLSIALDALGGETGSIMLASSPAALPRTLSVASSTGLQFNPERSSLEFGQAVAGWVAAHARPLRLVGRLDAYPQFRAMTSNPRHAESLVAPLLFRHDVLGTVSINSSVPGRFGPERLALLVSIAELLAAALQRNRVERAREHQDRLAVLGQLSASIAHELNNPLAALLANGGLLSAMLRDTDADNQGNEVRAVVRDMQESVDRMVSLISSLKGTARKPTGTLREIDLDAVLERAEILVHPQFKHRVRLVVERGAPPSVKADSARIAQILINLLVNASQAVGNNGQVTMRSRAEGRWAIVEVQDNGAGIPAEVAAHLFEPFFTTKPEGEGTGLGLSISRQIAREYGGDLTFRDGDSGTCFQLKLPVASEPEVSSPTVLVVDDEPSLLRAVERVLRRSFVVLSAAGPAEAVALASTTKVDLILTDYSMPKQNGVALVRRLRECGVRAPAVLLTAVRESSDITEALTDGLIAKVISKPWNPATLVAELVQLAAGNHPSEGGFIQDL